MKHASPIINAQIVEKDLIFVEKRWGLRVNAAVTLPERDESQLSHKNRLGFKSNV